MKVRDWVGARGSQLGHTGCVARGDFAVEDQAEFGVGESSEGAQAMHFAKKGQLGLQLIQKAGVHRLGQDQVRKPTNLGECDTRISKDRGCTCSQIYLVCMEHRHDKGEDYSSWRLRQDMC